jgi:DMSO/TMAO reductase YedYZ heme-binding membrane subunit
MVRAIVLFLALYTYAAVRYHIGQQLEWDQFFFVLNKAISWMAFILLTTSILKNEFLSKSGTSRRWLGVSGFYLALVHILLAVILLCLDKYPKFLTNGQINILGWGVVSLGILAIIIFSIPFTATLGKHANSNYFKIGKWGVMVIFFHPVLIGWGGWFTPTNWPLFMPPITLLSALYGSIIWYIRWRNA